MSNNVIGSILGKSFFGNKLIINNKRTYVNRFFILGKSFGNVFLFGVSVNARILLLYEVFNEMSIMELVNK